MAGRALEGDAPTPRGPRRLSVGAGKNTVAGPVPAGLGTRARAFAWDYLVIAGYLVVLVGAGGAMARLWPRGAQVLFGGPLPGEATGFVLITLPVTLYFALAEAGLRQATWGKRKVGLRVVRGSGGRMSLLRSLVRTALKFVPWELAHAFIWQMSYAADPSATRYGAGLVAVWALVGLNVVSLLLSPGRQTLYDRLTGTRVLRETSAAAPAATRSRRIR